MNNGYDTTKLTAYALGELDEQERLQVARQIENNPDAQREVEEIRSLAGVLTEELATIPAAGLTDAQHEQLEHRVTTPMRVVGGAARRRSWPQRLLVGAAAAACLALGVMAIQPLLTPMRDPGKAVAAKMGEDQTIARLANPISTPPHKTEVASGGKQVEVVAERELAPVDIKLPRPSYVGTPKKLPPGVIGPNSGSYQISRSPWVVGANRDGIYDPSSEGTGNLDLDTILIPDFAGGGGRAGQRIDHSASTESYDRIIDNPFLKVIDQPLSTFSIDVDTASYANLRRFITGGQLPPKDAVRIEEMINYFPYQYQAPDGPHPFSVHVEVSACPWNGQHRLARIALKGKEIAFDQRPPANLVFLIDVSGSMQPANKLPLLKQAMKMMVQKLSEADRVAIVVYASNSGVVLPSTSCERKDIILAALDRLEAGGSTNGGEGIQLAYQIATSTFIPKGTNRVILATDGDFNVGMTSRNHLTQLIEQKAKSGVFLSVLGFGMGNIKDGTMETLADKGNGNYAYIDTMKEAQKVLVDQLAGTLITIAKDVKLQLEFNPAQVAGYRLIGYENRMLQKEDFNDDRKDAGEIGAGHTVTALYEIVPAGVPLGAPAIDDLKYQKPAPRPQPVVVQGDADNGELMTVKLRYKQPDGEKSALLEVPVIDGRKDLTAASEDFRFAAGVAAYGMILRDSPYKGTATLNTAMELAKNALGKDEEGHRREFLSLVRLTAELKTPQR